MISRRTFILSVPVFGLVSGDAFGEPHVSSAIVSGQALATVNNFRVAGNRDLLVIDPRAERAALRHSEEMARLGKLTHDNFNERLANAEIGSNSAENVGVGHDSVSRVIRAWQQSTNHRRNLLGPYNGFGMAVARSSNSGNTPYWTMILSA